MMDLAITPEMEMEVCTTIAKEKPLSLKAEVLPPFDNPCLPGQSRILRISWLKEEENGETPSFLQIPFDSVAYISPQTSSLTEAFLLQIPSRPHAPPGPSPIAMKSFYRVIHLWSSSFPSSIQLVFFTRNHRHSLASLEVYQGNLPRSEQNYTLSFEQASQLAQQLDQCFPTSLSSSFRHDKCFLTDTDYFPAVWSRFTSSF